MHVVAHRLRKFGFEPSINLLSNDDLDVLATLVYKHQAEAIQRELADRAACLLNTER
jgi:hypothetical protein